MSDARFPIGKFIFDGPPDPTQRERFIDDIAQVPPLCAPRCTALRRSRSRRPIARADGPSGKLPITCRKAI